jgi:type III restriction enzyme
VRGFQMGVRNRITVDDWSSVARTTLDPQDLPSTSAMAAALNMNRPSVTAPGGAHMATLEAFRAEHREQQLAYQMSADLTRLYSAQPTCEAPPHVLFPQVLRIVQQYLDQKVMARAPAVRLDAFLSPYLDFGGFELCQAA